MKAIELLEEERFNIIIQRFQLRLNSLYNVDIAEWCSEFWKYIAE